LNNINEKIINRLPMLMTQNTINPVKDYIFSLPWDGVSRIEDFANTLKVDGEKRELSNKIIKTWLLQCVAALDRAKIGTDLNHYAVAKFELILVLQGVQGLKKTKWFGHLLPPIRKGEKFSSRYIKDGSHLILDNKDSIKQNVSCWINELGELDATFRKSDIAQLKAFCSNQTDTLRLPYAKTECSFQRSTSFCASVNDEQFLNDNTGSRRFGVLAVKSIVLNHGIDMQQLWAEIWQLYTAGHKWWLDKETEQEMQVNNENHQTANPLEETIQNIFDFDAPKHEWIKRYTRVEIYNACFSDTAKRKDLNAIKPYLEKMGVSFISPKNKVIFFMPPLKLPKY